jgi:hypothetical protein
MLTGLRETIRRGEASLLRQARLAQSAHHLLPISGVEAHELIERVGFANGHRWNHLEKRRDMLLGFVDAAEERQGVGEIEMR